MIEVLVTKEEREFIELEEVDEVTPIFIKKDGKLLGMVVEELGKGWIAKIGGPMGVSGHSETRRQCLLSCKEFEYNFFIA